MAHKWHHRYEWVDIEEDMPPDSLTDLGKSIPVLVKALDKNGHSGHIFAYYNYEDDNWYSSWSNMLIKRKIIAWTTDM